MPHCCQLHTIREARTDNTIPTSYPLPKRLTAADTVHTNIDAITNLSPRFREVRAGLDRTSNRTSTSTSTSTSPSILHPPLIEPAELGSSLVKGLFERLLPSAPHTHTHIHMASSPMLEFRTPGFNPYAVKYSPYYDSRIAVASAANYGIVGNGRLFCLRLGPQGIVVEKTYV